MTRAECMQVQLLMPMNHQGQGVSVKTSLQELHSVLTGLMPAVVSRYGRVVSSPQFWMIVRTPFSQLPGVSSILPLLSVPVMSHRGMDAAKSDAAAALVRRIVANSFMTDSFPVPLLPTCCHRLLSATVQQYCNIELCYGLSNRRREKFSGSFRAAPRMIKKNVRRGCGGHFLELPELAYLFGFSIALAIYSMVTGLPASTLIVRVRRLS